MPRAIHPESTLDAQSETSGSQLQTLLHWPIHSNLLRSGLLHVAIIVNYLEANGKLIMLNKAHAGGNSYLKDKYSCKIVGPRADEARIPLLDEAVGEGDVVQVGQLRFRVFDTPGAPPRAHLLAALFISFALTGASMVTAIDFPWVLVQA